MLYHLLTERIPCGVTGDFRPPSLESEGFIHFCFDHQVEWVANQFLRNVPALWAAEIDPALLEGESLKYEDPGVGQEFPHYYGPLPCRAIERLIPLSRNGEGEWKFQAG